MHDYCGDKPLPSEQTTECISIKFFILDPKANHPDWEFPWIFLASPRCCGTIP